MWLVLLIAVLSNPTPTAVVLPMVSHNAGVDTAHFCKEWPHCIHQPDAHSHISQSSFQQVVVCCILSTTLRAAAHLVYNLLILALNHPINWNGGKQEKDRCLYCRFIPLLQRRWTYETMTIPINKVYFCLGMSLFKLVMVRSTCCAVSVSTIARTATSFETNRKCAPQSARSSFEPVSGTGELESVECTHRHISHRHTDT